MAYQQERAVAIAAVKQAAQLCEAVRHQRQESAIQKQDRSPVTIADFGAQAIICQALAAAFPEDPVVGEESATLLRQPHLADQLAQITAYVAQEMPATAADILQWIDHGTGQVSDRYWTLDPIDGTKGFLRGDQYAIALALIEAGQVKLGVMGCPALTLTLDGTEERGVLFVAVRGQGAQAISLRGDRTYPLTAARCLEHAHRRMAESVESEHGNPVLQRQIAEMVGLEGAPLPMDSQAKYGLVASGTVALYSRLTWTVEPNYRENIWDHAPGVIVVEEAGGMVTDMYGRPLDFAAGRKLIHNEGIVVSNGELHGAVLEAMRAVAWPPQVGDYVPGSWRR